MNKAHGLGDLFYYAEKDMDPSSPEFQKKADVAFERAARDFGLIFSDIKHEYDHSKDLAVARAYIIGTDAITALPEERFNGES